MDPYSEIALQAAELLRRRDDLPTRALRPWLLVEFAMRAAILAEQAPSPKLAKVIEFVDQGQHMVMTAEEVARAVIHLQERGIVRHEHEALHFSEVVWNALPRGKSGKLSTAKRDRNLSERVKTGQS